MEFRKVKPGQDLEIPAMTWNGLMDTARQVRQQNAGTRVPQGLHAYNATVVTVKNVSGEPIRQYRAVRLGDPIIFPSDNEEEFKQRVTFKADVPEGNEEGRWAVLLEPLAAGVGEGDEDNGAIGRAVVIGVVVCRIDLIATGDTHVDVVAGETIPESSTSGPAQILWVAGGPGTATATGEQWALIKLGAGGSLPVGQYQYMTFQVVSQNTNGFDFTRSHPMLPS